MEKRRFGRLGWEVSALALGTWGLSGDGYGPIYYKEIDRILDRCAEVGVDLYETADVYGNGAMEAKLGERLDPGSTRVITKLGTFVDAGGGPTKKKFDEASLRTAFEKSQDRLKRNVVDVVLLHCPSQKAMDAGEGVGLLKQLKKDGKIAAWGVSAGSVAVAQAAIDQGAEVLQMAYNVFHASDLHALTDAIAATDTAVVARSVLAHGLLCGLWPAHKVFASYDHRSKRWTPEELGYRLKQLRGLRWLVGDEIFSLRAAALRFALANQLVSAVVLGPRSTMHFDQAVREIGDGPPYLGEEQLTELPARLEAVGITL